VGAPLQPLCLIINRFASKSPESLSRKWEGFRTFEAKPFI